MSDQDNNTMDGVPPAPGPTSLSAALTARYDLLGELGRGGMGIVYKARDRETGEIVALKVLKPEIAARPDLIERFKTELRLARKITHKNVCRTHDLHRFGDTVVIAMEYIEGESLRAALNRPGGVSLRGGLNWASQICAALAEAHAQGVVHRDLKPENVLIDRQGQAKVMDFGIARSTESGLTQAGVLLGTPAYMSPEQAQGKPADARSDIYSLGLVLYEMFTGRPAFKADTPVALAVKQIHETPPPPREVEPHLPGFLERAIERCLEKSPNKRFQSVAELEAALAEKAETKPAAIPGQEVELPIHLTRWQRSDWLLVVAAIAGLALFFPFFNRTSLAPRSKVSFDRSALRLKAQEYAQRLGAAVGEDSEVGTWNSPDRYNYLAETAGAPRAVELSNNPIPYWGWYVSWKNGTRVDMDNGGSLLNVYRDLPAPTITQTPLTEEAKPLAEKALRDFFNRDASHLPMRNPISDFWQGYPSISFTWPDPVDYHGLKRTYTVRLVGREIVRLDENYEIPRGFEFQTASSVNRRALPLLALGLPILILGFFRRQNLDVNARWRTITLALLFVLGVWETWRIFMRQDVWFRLIFSTTLGLASAGAGWLMCNVVEWSVRRAAPHRLSNFVALFGRGAASKPCGLAILRGTFIGLALLGINSFLIWLATNHLGMRLDSFTNITMQTERFLRTLWPIAHIFLSACSGMLDLGFTIAFLASFPARFLRWSWLAASLLTAMVALAPPVMNIVAVEPYHLRIFLSVVPCLVLVWTFTRFDFLTLLWAIFTLAFWWENYSMLVILEKTGSLEDWIAFAVWGLFVMAAAAVAFKLPLRAAFRRAATAFE